MLKMINHVFWVLCSTAIAVNPVFAIDALEFNKTKFIYQTSSNTTHSYVPPNQGNKLDWKEKISIIYASDVKNETELELLATKLHHSYKNKGQVLKALKIDPESNNSSKFLLVAVMKSSDAVEAILSRVSIDNSEGTVLVYAHRFYGEERSKELMSWFENNGFRMEKEILEFQSIPTQSAFSEPKES